MNACIWQLQHLEIKIPFPKSIKYSLTPAYRHFSLSYKNITYGAQFSPIAATHITRAHGTSLFSAAKFSYSLLCIYCIYAYKYTYEEYTFPFPPMKAVFPSYCKPRPTVTKKRLNSNLSHPCRQKKEAELKNLNLLLRGLSQHNDTSILYRYMHAHTRMHILT